MQAKSGPPPKPVGNATFLEKPPDGFKDAADPNIAESKPDPSKWQLAKPILLNAADYEPSESKTSTTPRPSCIGAPSNAPSAQRDYIHDTINDKYCSHMTNGFTSGAYGPVGYKTPGAANTLWLSVSPVPGDGCAKGFKVDKKSVKHSLAKYSTNATPTLETRSTAVLLLQDVVCMIYS